MHFTHSLLSTLTDRQQLSGPALYEISTCKTPLLPANQSAGDAHYEHRTAAVMLRNPFPRHCFLENVRVGIDCTLFNVRPLLSRMTCVYHLFLFRSTCHALGRDCSALDPGFVAVLRREYLSDLAKRRLSHRMYIDFIYLFTYLFSYLFTYLSARGKLPGWR